MGYCKDCRHYEIETKWDENYWNKTEYHVCTNYSVKEAKLKDRDGSVRVSAYGSCNYFDARTTEEEVGYHEESRGGCFLTSACVEYLGKQDDCEELTLLRNFRDGYMKNISDGENLIKEYYEIAPKIVTEIKAAPTQKSYFEYIYSIIANCVDYIKSNKNECALKEYIEMVQYLKREFNIE